MAGDRMARDQIALDSIAREPIARDPMARDRMTHDRNRSELEVASTGSPTGTNYCRRYLRAAVAAFLAAWLALFGADAPARASIEKPLDPCRFVSNDDVLHLLGWTVESRRRQAYDLHGGTGAMCFIASSQGQVIVIAPDPGTDYPGISVQSDPNAAGLAKHVSGLGAEVTLYNGTVYVVKAHRNIAVRVVPESHMASYDEIEGFAKVLIRRFH